MGVSGLLSLEGSDIGGFVGASVLGYLAGVASTSGPWAAVIQILVTYHLFLLWLIFRGGQSVGFAMSPAATLATHAACMAVVLLPLSFPNRHIGPNRDGLHRFL